MERIQKIIANSGYCSRRKAEELITNGKVKINNKVETTLGLKISGTDIVEVEGHKLKKEEHEYILLYKPRGYITTTSDEKNRKTVMDLVKSDKRLYPVGRLDYNTSGIILLTNDGELTNKLIHPKHNVDKVYVAKIEGLIHKNEVKKLCGGVVIDGKKTAKAKARIKSLDLKKHTSIVELTIHEGKNHQIKKMFESIGYTVIKLKREKFSFLDLKGLKSGEYRKLNIKEVKKLYSDI